MRLPQRHALAFQPYVDFGGHSPRRCTVSVAAWKHSTPFVVLRQLSRKIKRRKKDSTPRDGEREEREESERKADAAQRVAEVEEDHLS